MFRLLRSCSSARALCVLGGSISAARCEDSSVPRCQRPANGNAVLWRQNPKCEPCGAVLSEEQISHNVKLHHSRNRKPPRDSPEWQGNNEVFRSIKTFTAELKDLLISVHRGCWEVLAPDVFFQAQIVDSEMLKHEVLNKRKSHKLLGMKGIYPRRTGGISGKRSWVANRNTLPLIYVISVFQKGWS